MGTYASMYRDRSPAQWQNSSSALRALALIRRGTGNPEIPIHVIGGVGHDVSAAQVNAFVRATRDCGVTGASLYDFTTTVSSGWKYLRTVRVRPAAPKSACL